MTHAFETTPRKRLTDQQRAKLFLDHDGRCYRCTRKIRPGEPWEDEHVQSLENGGSNDMENRRPICLHCHPKKTAEDRKLAAKTRAVAVAHVIAPSQRQKKGPPIPGSKRSKFRKRMDGTVERR